MAGRKKQLFAFACKPSLNWFLDPDNSIKARKGWNFNFDCVRGGLDSGDFGSQRLHGLVLSTSLQLAFPDCKNSPAKFAHILLLASVTPAVRLNFWNPVFRVA